MALPYVRSLANQTCREIEWQKAAKQGHVTDLRSTQPTRPLTPIAQIRREQEEVKGSADEILAKVGAVSLREYIGSQT